MHTFVPLVYTRACNVAFAKPCLAQLMQVTPIYIGGDSGCAEVSAGKMIQLENIDISAEVEITSI